MLFGLNSVIDPKSKDVIGSKEGTQFSSVNESPPRSRTGRGMVLGVWATEKGRFRKVPGSDEWLEFSKDGTQTFRFTEVCLTS